MDMRVFAAVGAALGLAMLLFGLFAVSESMEWTVLLPGLLMLGAAGVASARGRRL